jgi:hypothetical protein
MNVDRMFNKVVAGYATGVRGDLTIADFQKLDSVSAHVLLEFEPKLGRPSGNDIERYFSKVFEGQIVPVMSSCNVKPRAVSVVARLAQTTRPIEDAGKMVPVIANLMYLDSKLQDSWEVKDEEGKKVLSRVVKENIDQIIAARRNRMFVTKTPSVSLASLASVKDLLQAGDTVKAYRNGEIVEALLTEALKGGFKAQIGGKDTVLAKEAILDIQQQAAAKAPNESAKLQKYFEEAFGDKEYAKQLVKKA